MKLIHEQKLSKSKINSFLKLAKYIGVTKKAMELYLAVLCLGKGGIQELGRALGNENRRTLIYRLIDELTRQGLLEVSFRGKRKVYSAVNPKVIINKLKKREKACTNEMKHFKYDILPLLNSTMQGRERKNLPFIEIYRGEQELRKITKALVLSSQVTDKIVIKGEKVLLVSKKEKAKKTSLEFFLTGPCKNRNQAEIIIGEKTIYMVTYNNGLQAIFINQEQVASTLKFLFEATTNERKN